MRRIAGLPASPAAEELLTRAQNHLRDADTWTGRSPPTEEREKLMNSVLALHMEVAKLEKERS
jgi:hypothetical protein